MRRGVKAGQLKVVSEDQIYDLHLAVLSVLEKHGMCIKNKTALNLLSKAGSEVDFKKQVAKIPGYLVEEAIAKAPRSIRLAGRNPKNDFILEDRKVFFRVNGLAVNIRDLETGIRRKSTIQDVARGAKISDGLPNLDSANEVSTAMDVPMSVVGLYKERAIMCNTTKHFILAREHGIEVERERIRMAELVAGGDKKLRKRPFISMFISPTSPMVLSKEDAQVIMEWGKARLPLVCASAIYSGGSGPVTLAGTVVQGVAESLAGNVLMQLINPGTPYIFGLLPFVLDMRSSAVVTASVEASMMCSLVAQIAHYYGLPSIASGGFTEAKTLDGQAVFEAFMTLTMSALSGINLLQGIGYLESGITGSYEMVVICNEIAGMLRKFSSGIQVDDDTLAVEAVAEAGHGGHFLGLKHTREHFFSEHFIPELVSRTSFEKWRKAGEKRFEERAREKALAILKDHYVEPIDEDIIKEINLIISKVEKRESKNQS